jgi:hypothetical protein
MAMIILLYKYILELTALYNLGHIDTKEILTRCWQRGNPGEARKEADEILSFAAEHSISAEESYALHLEIRETIKKKCPCQK